MIYLLTNYSVSDVTINANCKPATETGSLPIGRLD